MSDSALRTKWAPETALNSRNARHAIQELGHHLAQAGFINRFGRLQIDDECNADLAELALGKYIDVAKAARFLGGPQSLVALLETGLATITEERRFSLAFEVLSDGKAMAILPFLDSADDVPVDSVYAGADTTKHGNTDSMASAPSTLGLVPALSPRSLLRGMKQSSPPISTNEQHRLHNSVASYFPIPQNREFTL